MPAVTVATQPVYGLPGRVVYSRLSALILGISSLAGYWRLNEPVGSAVANDSGPNKLSGSVSAGVTCAAGRLTPSDKTANSFKFNGSSGYVAVPSNAALNLGDTLTVMALVKASGSNGIVSGGSTAYYMRVASGYAIDILVDRSKDMGNSGSFSGGTVHHIAWTKSGSTNHVYLDGLDVTGSISNGTCSNTTIALHIGADDNGSGGVIEFFSGQIAEVALFSAALTAAQIAQIASLALT